MRLQKLLEFFITFALRECYNLPDKDAESPKNILVFSLPGTDLLAHIPGVNISKKARGVICKDEVGYLSDPKVG